MPTLSGGHLENSPIDPDELIQAAEDQMVTLENPGFCRECGERNEGFEPDAENERCSECGAFAVDGAFLLVIKGYAD